MNSKEIASILRACQKAGVDELKYEGLEVKFRHLETVVTSKPGWTDSIEASQTQFNFSTEESPQQMSEIDELTHMLKVIEDPLAWQEEEMRDDGHEVEVTARHQ